MGVKVTPANPTHLVIFPFGVVVDINAEDAMLIKRIHPMVSVLTTP